MASWPRKIAVIIFSAVRTANLLQLALKKAKYRLVVMIIGRTLCCRYQLLNKAKKEGPLFQG
jgi:hypothetical protein